MPRSSAQMPHPELAAMRQRIAPYTCDEPERPIVICCPRDSVTRDWGNGSLLYHEAYLTHLIGALHVGFARQ